MAEKCSEFCGCGMPCTVDPEKHRTVGAGELLHACDVHWPGAEKSEFHEGPFETIELVTKDDIIVAYGNLAPFNVYPEVVLWGNRVFKLKSEASEGLRAVYTEVFAVAATHWKLRLEQTATPDGGKS